MRSATRASGRVVLLLVVALAWSCKAARAQAIAPPALTEQQLLGRLEQTPRMEVLRARIDAARAEIAAARVLHNPALSYDRESVSGQHEEYVRAVVPVDVSGRRGRRILAAEAGAAAASAQVDRDGLLLRLEALELFYDVAHARLRAELLRADRDALGILVARLRARASAGDASGHDATRMEIELGEQDDLLADVERELAVARRSLGLLVGRNHPVDAADTLALGNAPAQPSTAETRADLHAARLRRQQADAQAAAAGRGWVPALELSGGLKSVREGDARANGYLAGVNLSLPLWDHGQSDQARARARQRETEAEARSLEASIPVAQANAREAHARTVAQATTFRDSQFPRAETLLRRAEGLYREGERPVFELIDAHRTARQVRLRALQLRRNAKQTELELWRALGRRP